MNRKAEGVRRAGSADLDEIVAMRCEMWNEHHPDDISDAPFRGRVRSYYAEVLSDGSAPVWIASDAQGALGMVTLLVHRHPPRKHGEEVRGYVTAVYVRPHARRRGHARRLMEIVVEHAREQGMLRLTLRTSTAGRSVYLGVGVNPLEHLAIDLR